MMFTEHRSSDSSLTPLFNHTMSEMKRILTLTATLFSVILTLQAQEAPLPPDPEPGQCFVRCVTPDVWVEEDVDVLQTPAYTKIEVIPAEYKNVEQEVIIRPATIEYVNVPARFDTVEEVVELVQPYNQVTVDAASFVESTEDVEVQAAYAKYEYQTQMENCDEDDPRKCMVLCYVEHPAKIRTLSVKKMTKDATVTRKEAGRETTTITTLKMVEASKVVEKEVPALIKTITKRVLVRDEVVKEIEVPAVYTTETRRVLKEKGGLTVWEPIQCSLTDYNVLPIFYEYNRARLLPEAVNVIDTTILSLMKAKPLITVEIESHTDSRGDKAFNMDLSQRRVQSVVDYLVSRGIRKDRLIARGYGEERLTNPCKDGVPCSEAEHQENRRTEFRVVSQ